LKWTQESARVAREGRAQARRWVGSYRWTDGRGGRWGGCGMGRGVAGRGWVGVVVAGNLFNSYENNPP